MNEKEREKKWEIKAKQNLDYSKCGKGAGRGKLESEAHKYVFKEKEEGRE